MLQITTHYMENLPSTDDSYKTRRFNNRDGVKYNIIACRAKLALTLLVSRTMSWCAPLMICSFCKTIKTDLSMSLLFLNDFGKPVFSAMPGSSWIRTITSSSAQASNPYGGLMKPLNLETMHFRKAFWKKMLPVVFQLPAIEESNFNSTISYE